MTYRARLLFTDGEDIDLVIDALIHHGYALTQAKNIRCHEPEAQDEIQARIDRGRALVLDLERMKL